MFTESPYKELVKAAVEVKDKAYCPYSNFHVGAAVLTSSNQIFTGIGNASVSSRFSLSFYLHMHVFQTPKPIHLADELAFYFNLTIPRGMEW